VLLADGKKQRISTLKRGEKVLATDTRTGKNHAEAVTAVLVHHDRDLYDLKVRAAGRAAVIDTTSSHLFWDQTSRRWVKAGALKYGTHLRTPSGSTATVLGGHTPRDTTGWMWDLTITPSHDFYIETVVGAILVHNVTCGPFHRLESPTQTPEDAAQQVSSGEVWGRAPRGSDIPKVQAYEGPLPEGARGIEFTTDVTPDPYGIPGQPEWSGPRPGVRVEDEFAKICATSISTSQC